MQSRKIGLWLALAGALLGISQQLALVVLPLLSDRLHISYRTLVNLQAAGSMLFLLSAPFWGRQLARYGIRQVLQLGLSGYITSAAVLVGLWVLASDTPQWPTAILAGFVVSRLIYGLFASAITPQVQNISLALRRTEPVAALAQVNLGGTLARCITPLIGTALVLIDVRLLLLLPILVAGYVWLTLPAFNVPVAESDNNPGRKVGWLPVDLALLAFITAFSLCYGQFSLAPALLQVNLSPRQSAVYIGWTLGLTAMVTSSLQFYMLRHGQTSPKLLLGAGIIIASGGALLAQLSNQSVLLCLAMGLLMVGCNALTLGYSAKLVSGGNSSTTSWIATLHTLGYGAGALMINLQLNAGYALIAVLLLLAFSLQGLTRRAIMPRRS